MGGRVKRDKLFFFYDKEGLRYAPPSGAPIYIPAAALANYVLTICKVPIPVRAFQYPG
jgi:hypothetical protein